MTSSAAEPVPSQAIAIIGMSGRFPQSPTLDDFWRNLRAGVECLTRFSDEELAECGIPEALRRDPRYVPVRGVIEGHDLFDAAFFGINPREAELIDPQQRLLLECGWEALENAGYDSERPSGPVGVYAGVGMNLYLLQHVLQAAALHHPGAAYQAFIGNDKDFCATRLAYKLGLRGPAVNVQTACSTSLVAVNLACQALLTFQCDMALAGAAAISLPRAHGYLYEEGMILSPDGHCRTFDVSAKGTVPSEGVAVVVLKRFEDALADRDPIRAVILGSGMNNDGALKAGYTAPSVQGQAEAIQLAMAMAGVDAESIQYIEAHGTATPLGDPIEIAALTRAFQETTSRKAFCAIGSVKSNIGHADTVAGLAGLIKTVLALEHREIPPSLHFTAPNPALTLDRSPFRINATLTPWVADGTPRRAGVSSFGIGGTNAHVLIEEAPPRGVAPVSSDVQTLCLSARSEAALDNVTARLALHLEQHPDIALSDVAFTLRLGRRPFEHRRTIVARSRAQAIAALNGREPRLVGTARAKSQPPSLVFLFTGQGAQYPAMGAALYAAQPVFRDVIDAGARVLEPLVGCDIRQLLLPSDPTDPAQAAALMQTQWAQPAIFLLDYALARLWQSLGVQPDAMLGHSLGEYVAATVAGVFEPDDALRLVAARARLMQNLPVGAMVTVSLSEGELRPWLSSDLSIAAVNGPRLSVASGPVSAIEQLESRLRERATEFRRLHTSHAFHSSMMDGALEPFRAALSRIRLSPPSMAYVSNLTGRWIRTEDATSPEYWMRHLRGTVRFADGVSLLAGEASRVWLEVGPGRVLASLVRQQVPPGAIVVTSLRHADEAGGDDETFATALAHLWRVGVNVRWSVPEGTGSRVALPGYPFERQRFWLDHESGIPGPGPLRPTSGVPEKRQDVASWFYAPSWVRTAAAPDPPPLPSGASLRPCLVFADETPFCARVLERLGQCGYRTIPVRIGESFGGDVVSGFQIRLHRPSDISEVFARLSAVNATPDRIVHLWGVSIGTGHLDLLSIEDGILRNYASLVGVAQGLANHSSGRRSRVLVITTHQHDVMGGDRVIPEHALSSGPCRTMGLENPEVVCRSIDVEPSVPGSPAEQAQLNALLAELEWDSLDQIVAYRNGRRWTRHFIEAPMLEAAATGLRYRGVYLITGGFGGIGAALAMHLARTTQARLVLLGRVGPPPRETWSALLDADDADDDANRAAAVARQILALENAGAEVMAFGVDVADSAAVQRIIEDVRARFGTIDGVIHAAGVAGGGMMHLVDPEATPATFGAKVFGTLALRDAVGSMASWMLLCSSRDAVLSSVGAADYGSANAFLDAFAVATDAPDGMRVISIEWDRWQDVGMAVHLKVPAHLERAKQEHLRGGLTSAEGVDVFQRVLAHPAPQVLVLTQAYNEIVTQQAAARQSSSAPSAGPLLNAGSPDAVGRHQRPSISATYAAATNDAERAIVPIWEALLGIEGIGIHDDFFELGGHSLLATQLVSRLRETFGIQVPLRTIFDANTVSELARYVGGASWVLQSATGESRDGDREELEL